MVVKKAMYTIGGELVYVWGRTCIRLGANLLWGETARYPLYYVLHKI